MNSLEFMEYCDAMMIGEESFASLMEITEKVGRSIAEFFIEVINYIAAELIVLVSRLKGFRTYKKYNEILYGLALQLESIIDECIYTTEKYVQGFSKVKNGNYQDVIFKPRPISEVEKITMTQYRAAIDEYKRQLENPEAIQWEVDGFERSAIVQAKMLSMSRKLKKLQKMVKTTTIQKKKMEAMGMNMDYIDQTWDINRKEIMEYAQLFFDACNLVRIKQVKNSKFPKANNISQPEFE